VVVDKVVVGDGDGTVVGDGGAGAVVVKVIVDVAVGDGASGVVVDGAVVEDVVEVGDDA